MTDDQTRQENERRKLLEAYRLVRADFAKGTERPTDRTHTIARWLDAEIEHLEYAE